MEVMSMWMIFRTTPWGVSIVGEGGSKAQPREEHEKREITVEIESWGIPTFGEILEN